MLDEWVKLALVGTGRGHAAPPPGGPAADALAALASTDAESRLLAAVAVLSRYELCGRTPAASGPVPAPAEADVRPACSARAGELLRHVLSMTDTPTKAALLGEWLAAADRAGRRAPHAAIPPLLDYAAGHRAVRDAVAGAVDRRGAWLMAMNPKWRVGVAEHDDPAAVWSTGTKDQRVSALRRLRATDPAAAVALARSTWAEDGADERTAFVEALAAGLGDADEPFLEGCLDDRSKQVRAAAADLLARLPNSALVRRMTDRATPLLTFTPAVAGGLVRKGVAAVVAVRLPAAFDKGWERDGVTDKGLGHGQRQWWLRQLVAAVPPSHWSTAWGVAADAAVGAASDDFGDVLVDAWADATVRHPDAAWAAALLSDGARHGRGRPPTKVLDRLPPAEQRAVAAALLRSPTVGADVALDVVQRTSFPFDAAAADAVIVAIERHARGKVGSVDYVTPQLIDAVALRLPPDRHDEVAERWSTPEWDRHRRSVDGCLTTLHLRRDIQREFAS